MKNLLIGIGVATMLTLGLTGCEKECVSTCGVITDDEILDNECYSLTIRNECSDNYKTFCFDQSTWVTAFVGDNFCVRDVAPW